MVDDKRPKRPFVLHSLRGVTPQDPPKNPEPVVLPVAPPVVDGFVPVVVEGAGVGRSVSRISVSERLRSKRAREKASKINASSVWRDLHHPCHHMVRYGCLQNPGIVSPADLKRAGRDGEEWFQVAERLLESGEWTIDWVQHGTLLNEWDEPDHDKLYFMRPRGSRDTMMESNERGRCAFFTDSGECRCEEALMPRECMRSFKAGYRDYLAPSAVVKLWGEGKSELLRKAGRAARRDRKVVTVDFSGRRE